MLTERKDRLGRKGHVLEQIDWVSWQALARVVKRICAQQHRWHCHHIRGRARERERERERERWRETERQREPHSTAQHSTAQHNTAQHITVGFVSLGQD